MQRHHGFRHNGLWKIFLVLFVLMSLCGCSSSAKREKGISVDLKKSEKKIQADLTKNEEEILADLQKNPAFIFETVPIKDYEIAKRQTDVKNNSDMVYVTVHIDEGELKCTLSYVLNYVLYNEGWMLESVERDKNGLWDIGEPTDSQLLETLQEKGRSFQDYKNMVIQNCWVTKVYDGLDEKVHRGLSENEKILVVLVTAETEDFSYQGSYSLKYRIEYTGWENVSVVCEEESWEPKYAPDDETVDGGTEGVT